MPARVRHQVRRVEISIAKLDPVEQVPAVRTERDIGQCRWGDRVLKELAEDDRYADGIHDGPPREVAEDYDGLELW